MVTRSSRSIPKKEKFDGVSIGEDWTGEERPSYICDNCHCGPLVRLVDRSNQNESWYCNRCYISYSDTTKIRKESKISVPQETEPAVSIVNVDLTKDVEIRHPKELVWGAKELSRKGTIKFTHIEEGKG